MILFAVFAGAAAGTFRVPATLFATGFGYLLLLFLVAYATDRGLVPARLVSHPLTYTLSIGVYATSWTYYGSVGYAAHNGLLFLTIYIGATLTFILSPLLLRPILKHKATFKVHLRIFWLHLNHLIKICNGSIPKL